MKRVRTLPVSFFFLEKLACAIFACYFLTRIGYPATSTAMAVWHALLTAAHLRGNRPVTRCAFTNSSQLLAVYHHAWCSGSESIKMHIASVWQSCAP
jgi:hypothetical protein